MNNRKKVLLFVDRMRVGGIQIFLKNLYEHFDREKIQYDFLLLDDGEQYELEEELKKLGAVLYKLENIWLRKPLDYISYNKAMKRFFEVHNDYIAVHMNSGPKNFLVMYYAKKMGIPIRIAHSHNTGYQTDSIVQKILGNVLKLPLRIYANRYYACSDVAGVWMFGNRNSKSGKVDFIPNAIDLEKFSFNETVRSKIRKELNAEDQIIIGNVGRFTIQKNHFFLLEIFKTFLEKEPNSLLVLAGIGELLNDTKKKAYDLGIVDKVRFLGFRNDIMDLNQAFDVFLMPSLYEGFPVTGIEAQAIGVPCVFSDTITSSAKLLNESCFVSLEADVKQWTEAILNSLGMTERTKSKEVLTESGFDINELVKRLEKGYLGSC